MPAQLAWKSTRSKVQRMVGFLQVSPSTYPYSVKHKPQSSETMPQQLTTQHTAPSNINLGNSSCRRCCQLLLTPDSM
jgi:hypothetical protein